MQDRKFDKSLVFLCSSEVICFWRCWKPNCQTCASQLFLHKSDFHIFGSCFHTWGTWLLNAAASGQTSHQLLSHALLQSMAFKSSLIFCAKEKTPTNPLLFWIPFWPLPSNSHENNTFVDDCHDQMSSHILLCQFFACLSFCHFSSSVVPMDLWQCLPPHQLNGKEVNQMGNLVTKWLTNDSNSLRTLILNACEKMSLFVASCHILGHPGWLPPRTAPTAWQLLPGGLVS